MSFVKREQSSTLSTVSRLNYVILFHGLSILWLRWVLSLANGSI